MKTPGKFITLFLLTAALFSLTHCGSDDPKPVIIEEEVIVDAVVYVAGVYKADNAGYPAYWKNGTLVKLAETPGSADAIAVDGNNVYVIGHLYDNTNKRRLWTNGVMSDFSDGTNGTYVYSLRVFGGDLYAVGMASSANGDHATYWKNGVPHTVTTGNNSRAFDIAIVGADVYVAGFQYGDNGLAIAKFWKNGVGTTLSDGTDHADAGGIAVVNNDVYVSGKDKNTLKVWKNGIAMTINAGVGSGTSTGSIAVVNNDVYVVGYELNGSDHLPKYWKNGTSFTLPKPANAVSAYGYSMAVSGDEIFFLGEGSVDNTYPVLVWKNFELMEAYNGTNTANGYAMFVSR